MLLGKYYVQIKDTHIYWGERRKTNTRSIRKEESYIAIPASYAYTYNILKGKVYTCYWDNGEKCELKAAGSQSKRDYAKQFQGNGSLKIVYDWYKYHGAQEGDYAVVDIYDDDTVGIEYVSSKDRNRLIELNILGENGRVEEVVNNDIAFRLKSLIVRDGDVEHCNINFILDELKDVIDEPVVSLVIGANGSGKSFILKILAEIFNAVQNVKALSQMKYSYYELKYFYDGEPVEIQIVNKQIIIHKNGVLQENTFYLPKKILAVSFMLNDKFPFKKNGSEENVYEYLGIRVTSNASWTSSMSNKLADALLSLAEKGKIWDFLDKLSVFLNVDSKIEILCEMASKDFESDDILSVLKEAAGKVIIQDDYRSDAVKNYTDEIYNDLLKTLEDIKNRKKYKKKRKKIEFGFSVSASSTERDIIRLAGFYQQIKRLSNLKMITNMTLYIYKNGERYSFEDSSSGEKHILYTFTNIYNCIENNSLILIDEPEISLHPNWQIKYISFLKEVFKEYKTSHFVIASHSHYMVSDLNPNSSSLVAVQVVDGEKKFQTVEYSTYAWSAENILYNVFGVRTPRNYYFDSDVRELLYAVSQNNAGEIERIKGLYKKLSKYVLDEKDPLNQVIEQAGKYIRDVESI